MRTTARRDGGYAMAALLVAMSVMAVLLSVAMPVWRTAAQRERETELIFRGEQYAQAIQLYSRRFGGFPATIDQLLADSQPFLRKRYKDPITNDEFQVVYLGQIGTQQPGMPPGQGQPGQPGIGGRGGVPSGVGGIGAPGGLQPPGQGGSPIGGIGQGRPQFGTGQGGSPFGTGQTGSPFGQAGSPFGAGQPGSPFGQAGQGGGAIIGVVSKSTAQALRLYKGRGRYNEWLFVATAATQQPGAPVGSQQPGMPGGRGGGVGRPGLPGPGREGMPQRPRGGGPGSGNPVGPGLQPPGRGF